MKRTFDNRWKAFRLIAAASNAVGTIGAAAMVLASTFPLAGCGGTAGTDLGGGGSSSSVKVAVGTSSSGAVFAHASVSGSGSFETSFTLPSSTAGIIVSSNQSLASYGGNVQISASGRGDGPSLVANRSGIQAEGDLTLAIDQNTSPEQIASILSSQENVVLVPPPGRAPEDETQAIILNPSPGTWSIKVQGDGSGEGTVISVAALGPMGIDLSGEDISVDRSIRSQVDPGYSGASDRGMGWANHWLTRAVLRWAVGLAASWGAGTLIAILAGVAIGAAVINVLGADTIRSTFQSFIGSGVWRVVERLIAYLVSRQPATG